MRMKDCPREIQIGENTWDVKFVRRFQDKFTTGLCDPSETTIYIRMGQTDDERLKTLLHEILHAIEYEYQLEIPHRLIHRLEDPLARFLVDNYLS